MHVLRDIGFLTHARLLTPRRLNLRVSDLNAPPCPCVRLSREIPRLRACVLSFQPCYLHITPRRLNLHRRVHLRSLYHRSRLHLHAFDLFEQLYDLLA